MYQLAVSSSKRVETQQLYGADCMRVTRTLCCIIRTNYGYAFYYRDEVLRSRRVSSRC